jgi:hypothetical protein
VLYKIQVPSTRVNFGPFFEYRRNLTRANEFGRDEWLLGAIVRVDL